MSTQTVTEKDLIAALQRRYTHIRRGTNAERYVRAKHVRYPGGWGEALAIADYLTIDTYAPHAITGFEIKTSRSDWLTELRNPRKAEYWRKHCHQWYLVTSDKNIVKNDLPDGWGHITLTGSTLKTVTSSWVNTDPAPLTPMILSMLGRAIASTATQETAT